MTKRFENKVVVITGGSNGIGLTTAKLFASEGALVYITGRRQEPLDKAVAEIGNGAIGVQGNVADSADVVRLYERIKADHGRVDVVFANAGIYEVVGIEDIDEDHIDRMLNVNVKGMIFAVQKALPLMTAGGAIVLSGSVVSVKGLPNQTLYNASKAAVRSFARSWTAELKDRGIRVNVVAPSGTETPMIRNYLDERPGVEEMLAQSVPLGRLAKTEEVARAVMFLASSDSSFVAGHELFVDGGVAAV